MAIILEIVQWQVAPKMVRCGRSARPMKNRHLVVAETPGKTLLILAGFWLRAGANF